MSAPDLDQLRQLLDVDHTETDLEARARVLMHHLTGAEWDDMDPGTRSKVGTEMVTALHFADEIDPARQRLALVLAALPDLLARAEAADRLAAGDMVLVPVVDLRNLYTHWVGEGEVGDYPTVRRLLEDAGVLDPAQPTGPVVDADEGRRG